MVFPLCSCAWCLFIPYMTEDAFENAVSFWPNALAFSRSHTVVLIRTGLSKKANVSLSCDNICTLWWWAILKHNTCDHGESWKRDTSHTAPAKLLRYLFNVCIPVKFLLPKASWENVPHKDPRINSIFWFDNYLEPVQSHMYDGFQYNQTIKQLISLCSFRA